MASRAADATIRGYFYQFDKTIIEILDSADGDQVIVEGIEDIDIENATSSRAIQCKYIPSSKYLPSAVRAPIILMLDDHFQRFNRGWAPIDYRLYAHFSAEAQGAKGRPVYSLDEFKSLLTFVEKKVSITYHVDSGIPDGVLTDFLDRFTMEIGPSFEQQQTHVLKRLKKECSCNDVDADLLYYNTALRVVRELATCPEIARRRITKKEFLGRINVKRLVFDSWYLELRGERPYTNLIRQRIKHYSVLEPQFQRMIILGSRLLAAAGQPFTVARLIGALVDLYFKAGKTFSNVQPLTVVLEATKEHSRQIKRELLASRIPYNDGYEDLEFQPWWFDRPPVVNRDKVGHRPSSKLGKSSYQVRLVRSETYQRYVDDIGVPDKAVLFTDADPKLYFPGVEPLYVTAHANDLEVALKILS